MNAKQVKSIKSTASECGSAFGDRRSTRRNGRSKNRAPRIAGEQLSLFPLFDNAEDKNPPTRALPAGGKVGEARLPLPPPASGPLTGENPTTTALYGRRTQAECVAANESPVQMLAHKIADLLHDEPDCRIDNPRLDELSREVLGSAVGHARDAYDAAEAGMNLYINGLSVDGLSIDPHNGPEAIKQLLSLTQRMPRQSRRDERQVELQQFSTPPAQAFVVATAAAIRPGMSVLEPSAGTGNLAVFARMAGGIVETNEIDPRRSELLAMQGLPVTNIDAERLHNLLDPGKTFDAIVMNPPISATGGRVTGHNTKFGARDNVHDR